MMPMKPAGNDREVKSKILGDLQNEMAKRRVLTIKVDLEKGTVETEGGAPEEEMAPEPAAEGGEMGEPEDVMSRLKKLG